jgi:hypothetical protein
MNNAAATADNTIRPLRSADLERVIAIDSAHVGEPRRRFFEKRVAHAKQHPDDFVHVGVVRKGALVGFAFARILRGEFGREQAIATLDAVGVEADWTNHGLLRFFDSSGFGLAPRLVLERSVLTPLAEASDDE